MAMQVIKDVTALIANYDISGQANNFAALPVTVQALDKTNGASAGWQEFEPGLKSMGGTISGFTDDMTFDSDQLTGLQNVPFTLSLNNALAEGDIIHAYKANQTAFDRPMQVGQLLGYSGTFTANGAGVKGFALHVGAETATGASAGQNLGAVAAGQTIYAWQHVTATAGTSPTLDTLVESDATDAWVGAETTRFTFTQETDATSGYQWLTPVAGAITDTWWRVSYTITGSAGQSFTFVTGFAIL